MKQTAVEWLVEQLPLIQQEGLRYVIEEAKEMEINQHNETWDVAHQAGRFEGKGIAEENWQTFEGYWEENFKQQEQQAKEIEKQQKKDTKTMEKLIESNRKFDEKNNNRIKYNPNDRSEDNPNVTNFFI